MKPLERKAAIEDTENTEKEKSNDLFAAHAPRRGGCKGREDLFSPCDLCVLCG